MGNNCSSQAATDIVHSDTISVTIPEQWTPGKLVEVTIPEGAPNAGTTIRFPVPTNSVPGAIVQVPIGVDALGTQSSISSGNSFSRRFGSRPTGPLTLEQIAARTTQTPNTVLKLHKVTLEYACVSQCGYYPHELTKPNQDSYGVEAPLAGAGRADAAMFSVYDGHGEFGDLCSQFARDRVHANLTERLQRGQGFDQAYAAAFCDANNQLHADPRVDDMMSGTTAVSVIVKDGVLHIGNCGDSRAILISTAPGSSSSGGSSSGGADRRKVGGGKKGRAKVVAKALSKDQTPFRRDERERVKKTGARVMTMDQLDGMEPIHEDWDDVELGEQLDTIGDPPRVWAPHECYPGTAFTRSIGDAEAEDLGVCADPELHEHVLAPEDQYVVVASDGVFEFITNQEVADVVNAIGDPHAACQALVAESYKRWLTNEPRSDDITIIVMKLSDIRTRAQKQTEVGNMGSSRNESDSSDDSGNSTDPAWRGRHSVAFCGNNP
jgi:serine/threonine protein phosphatase PrpC